MDAFYMDCSGADNFLTDTTIYTRYAQSSSSTAQVLGSFDHSQTQGSHLYDFHGRTSRDGELSEIATGDYEEELSASGPRDSQDSFTSTNENVEEGEYDNHHEEGDDEMQESDEEEEEENNDQDEYEEEEEEEEEEIELTSGSVDTATSSTTPLLQRNPSSSSVIVTTASTSSSFATTEHLPSSPTDYSMFEAPQQEFERMLNSHRDIQETPYSSGYKVYTPTDVEDISDTSPWLHASSSFSTETETNSLEFNSISASSAQSSSSSIQRLLQNPPLHPLPYASAIEDFYREAETDQERELLTEYTRQMAEGGKLLLRKFREKNASSSSSSSTASSSSSSTPKTMPSPFSSLGPQFVPDVPIPVYSFITELLNQRHVIQMSQRVLLEILRSSDDCFGDLFSSQDWENLYYIIEMPRGNDRDKSLDEFFEAVLHRLEQHAPSATVQTFLMKMMTPESPRVGFFSYLNALLVHQERIKAETYFCERENVAFRISRMEDFQSENSIVTFKSFKSTAYLEMSYAQRDLLPCFDMNFIDSMEL